MSYSYYEVYTNAQRAFSSLGFPYGADEDAAYIITWFELYNLKGIDLFCSFMKTNDKQFNYKIDLVKNERVIDLSNKSNLITGPGVIDYIVSKFNTSNVDEFRLINCYDPIFLIPLLCRYIKKDIYGNKVTGAYAGGQKKEKVLTTDLWSSELSKLIDPSCCLFLLNFFDNLFDKFIIFYMSIFFLIISMKHFP